MADITERYHGVRDTVVFTKDVDRLPKVTFKILTPVDREDFMQVLARSSFDLEALKANHSENEVEMALGKLHTKLNSFLLEWFQAGYYDFSTGQDVTDYDPRWTVGETDPTIAPKAHSRAATSFWLDRLCENREEALDHSLSRWVFQEGPQGLPHLKPFYKVSKAVHKQDHDAWVAAMQAQGENVKGALLKMAQDNEAALTAIPTAKTNVYGDVRARLAQLGSPGGDQPLRRSHDPDGLSTVFKPEEAPGLSRLKDRSVLLAQGA